MPPVAAEQRLTDLPAPQGFTSAISMLASNPVQCGVGVDVTLLTSETSGDDIADGRYEPTRDNSSNELALGLQLMRASSITSNRLQLALARRDRKVAMAALDTLAAVDAEIEVLVDRLSNGGASTPELAAIGAWLAQENKAASADRLNLACDLSGPGLVSSSGALSDAADEGLRDDADTSSNANVPLRGSTEVDTAERTPTRRGWLLVVLAAAVLAAGLIVALVLLPSEASANVAEFSRLIGLS